MEGSEPPADDRPQWEGAESAEVTAPPEAIWAVVGDFERHIELAGSGEIRALRLDGPSRAGARWEADIALPTGDTFVATSECLVYQPPKAVSWSSVPLALVEGDDRSRPEVTWWFELEPAGVGHTRVDHRFRVVAPAVGADILVEYFEANDRPSTIRAGMRATLENLARLVEGERAEPGA